MRDDAVLGRALPLDRGLGPMHQRRTIQQVARLSPQIRQYTTLKALSLLLKIQQIF